MTVKLRSRLLLPINPAGSILLGLYTIVWGFWIANPWWNVFDRAALYSGMQDLAPEWIWGTVAVLSSLVTLYGAIRPSYRAFILGALILGWHWAMVALMYFWGDWQSTGGITSGMVCTYAMYIYLNVRVNRIGTPEQQLDEEHMIVPDSHLDDAGGRSESQGVS